MKLQYIVGQQLSVGVRGFQEILIRYLFLPEQLALWNLTQVIVTTGTLFQFNVLAAVNIRVAQRIGGKENEKEIDKTRTAALLLELAQLLIVFAIILIFGPLVWDTPKNFSQVIFICAAIVMIQTSLINLLTGFHESSSKFRRLGFLLPLNSVLQLAIIYLGSYYGDLLGLFFGIILGFFVCILLLAISLHNQKLLEFKRPDRHEAFQIGRPAISIKLADVGTSLFYALDVILASFWLTPVDLALFMTAKLMVGMLSQSIFAVNRMNLIKLGNDFGAKTVKSEIVNYLSIQFFVTYIVLIPLIAVFSVPLLNFIFPLVLPEYEASLTVLPFFLLCILCSPRAIFLRNVWIQSRAWNKIFVSGVFACTVFVSVFLVGGRIIDTTTPEGLGLIIFLGQLPYAIYIIVAVSLFIAGKKQTILWCTMFVISTCELILILDIFDSIQLFGLSQSLTLTEKVMALPILLGCAGLFSLNFLRKQENLIGRETYTKTLLRAVNR